MSEERSASFPPSPDATVATKAVAPLSDGAIDVAIEEGEPEVEAKAPVSKPPAAAPSSSRAGETTAKRVRAKVTLKIPDDEISRPQLTPSSLPAKPPEPPPVEAPMVPMTPMRIITIEPPPVAAKPPAVAPPPAPPAPVVPAPAPSTPQGPDDSWTPYQPMVADQVASASPPSVSAVSPVSAPPPVSAPRPPRPSYASAPPGSVQSAPQPAQPITPPQAPPRPSYHSAPTPLAQPAAAPVAIPVAPPTVRIPTPPPTEPRDDSSEEIPIVTDEPPPSSGEIEVDDDARPTHPVILRVPEPKLVPVQPQAPAVQIAHAVPGSTTVHTAVTPVASPVAPGAPAGPPPVAPAAVAAPPPSAQAPSSAVAPAPVSAGPIAPSPPRVVSVPPAAASQPQVSIKDLPPMRALAPTEPEGLEVHFEDEEPPVSTPRPSEPEAEIAPEDLVSVESAPSPSKVLPPKNALQTETPARGFLPVGAPVTGSPSAAAAQVSARASVPPPPSAAKAPGSGQKGSSPRVIVPNANALAPPPMGDAPTGRRKARPWWEELFNDDFIRTMAKISDAQIAKEVEFIEESLAVAKGAMLLDLGCGTGRHAIELTRRGYKVVGFDLSLPMLAKAAEEAQERSQKLNFVQGDMREMTFEDTFDGIYCWNTTFGFFEEDKNNQVIQRVHKALKKGGQFVLEVGNRDYIIRQAPSLAWFEGDGCICMDEMSIDWITSRMKVKRTMMMDDGRTKEIDYSVRIYSLHELGKILHESGFRVAEVSGRTGTPGVYFGNESPRTMILAEKK